MAEQRAVRIMLLALLGLSAAACLQLVLWPLRPPLPQEPDLTGLAALPLEPLGLQPPRRQREISTGTRRRWRWPQGAPGSARETLELDLLPVRLRRHQQLEVAAIQALLGQPIIGKAEPRQLGRDGLLLSRTPGRQELHTCWVAGKWGETKRDPLIQLRQPPPQSAGQRLQITLGLEPPRRWECLLIRLSGPAKPESLSSLNNAWLQLRPRLP